jgi:hypothetical protein
MGVSPVTRRRPVAWRPSIAEERATSTASGQRKPRRRSPGLGTQEPIRLVEETGGDLPPELEQRIVIERAGVTVGGAARRAPCRRVTGSPTRSGSSWRARGCCRSWRRSRRRTRTAPRRAVPLTSIRAAITPSAGSPLFVWAISRRDSADPNRRAMAPKRAKMSTLPGSHTPRSESAAASASDLRRRHQATARSHGVWSSRHGAVPHLAHTARLRWHDWCCGCAHDSMASPSAGARALAPPGRM